jgi:hypothetical protein
VNLELVPELERRERADADVLRAARGITAVDRCVADRSEVEHAKELGEFLQRLGYELISWFEARMPERRAA